MHLLMVSNSRKRLQHGTENNFKLTMWHLCSYRPMRPLTLPGAHFTHPATHHPHTHLLPYPLYPQHPTIPFSLAGCHSYSWRPKSNANYLHTFPYSPCQLNFLSLFWLSEALHTSLLVLTAFNIRSCNYLSSQETWEFLKSKVCVSTLPKLVLLVHVCTCVSQQISTALSKCFC